MTSETPRIGDLDALVATLNDRKMVVVAPHGTVNTGLVTGDQRQFVSTSAEGGTATASMRQGPVRAKYLKTVRRRFVPPPGFPDALAALESGIAVILGEPGTGRETHALNLLAHNEEEPVVVQVDGDINLSRWGPRAQGVHGYLVMEPLDPFALRAWDLSRLETRLAEAGARLIIVLADAPGLAGTLEDHLGIPVIRHHTPDPRKVFTAHLADDCRKEACEQWLRALEPGRLDELLPEGLPPRHAAQAAEAVLRLGVTGGVSGAEVLRHLTRVEGAEVVARAQKDPALLAQLLSISVYGGLGRDVVSERAGKLLQLAGSEANQGSAAQGAHGPSSGDTRRRPLTETLRLLGAHRVQGAAERATDTVSFYWPAMSGAVWEALCGDDTDLVPLLHTWLAGPGHETDQIERAGQALAAVAVVTGGRSLELLSDLASAPTSQASEVAAWCLGTAVQDPAAAGAAAHLLEQWSVATEAPLRKAVAYACRSDRGQVTDEQALRLLQRLMETPADDTGDLSVITSIVEALVQRFETGDSGARVTVLCRMRDWTETDDVPGLLAALTFPALAATDPAWWSDRIRADTEVAASTVRLAGHALNEAVTFMDMRDALLLWCSEAEGVEHRAQVLSGLLDALVDARQPGFLRWLLAVERGPDEMPGKEPAALALNAWRANTPAPETADQED
ncbi:hypothetical protein AB0I16_02990 [Streptomyces sp. NPDC050703]|uniref:hypothetical protein n=1 Tax=Streptomyces sp. NPDC050703 TaxID=3157218 RepID=UPI0034305D7E